MAAGLQMCGEATGGDKGQRLLVRWAAKGFGRGGGEGGRRWDGCGLRGMRVRCLGSVEGEKRVEDVIDNEAEGKVEGEENIEIRK